MIRFSSKFLLLFVSLSNLFADKPDNPKNTEKSDNDTAWVDLFDGKSLQGWEIIDYAGHSGITVKDKKIVIAQGEILAGIKVTDKIAKTIPTVDYEVLIKARKTMGNDFFVGLTFPFLKSHATWIVGGWGGGLVGISSIDDLDASENQTTTYRDFDMSRLYTLRLQVTRERIVAYIETKGEKTDRCINVGVVDRTVGMRFGEIEESLPFGISTFRTASEIESIRIRKLSKTDKDAISKLAEEDDF